jgi:hypothetical protein
LPTQIDESRLGQRGEEGFDGWNGVGQGSSCGPSLGGPQLQQRPGCSDTLRSARRCTGAAHRAEMRWIGTTPHYDDSVAPGRMDRHTMESSREGRRARRRQECTPLFLERFPWLSRRCSENA